MVKDFWNQKIKCAKCKVVNKRSQLRLLVLEDYDEKGGWIEHGLFCRPCIDAIETFMTKE